MKLHIVAFVTKNDSVELTEFLRYAGLVNIETNINPYHECKDLLPLREGELIVKMFCPKGLHGETWGKMNVARIKSFGRKVMYYTKRV